MADLLRKGVWIIFAAIGFLSCDLLGGGDAPVAGQIKEQAEQLKAQADQLQKGAAQLKKMANEKKMEADEEEKHKIEERDNRKRDEQEDPVSRLGNIFNLNSFAAL